MTHVHPQPSLTIAATEYADNPESARLLLSIRDVAELLGCSVRHVRRLVDAGRMLKPLRLGSLLRWRRAAIEEWVNAGCPAPRKG